ncbi:hypothetical protein SAMN05421740_105121 [Parapedobacter koreensis]|uniref:Uncharacterized protein n=1 Tax=Parapedobacter koreensis TaxID=332977 RepID=A0A1H7Q194_9SPHI|nr:hypothetical protein SAMN05421740_105121 [Parapedobacter koreensis]
MIADTKATISFYRVNNANIVACGVGRQLKGVADGYVAADDVEYGAAGSDYIPTILTTHIAPLSPPHPAPCSLQTP